MLIVFSIFPSLPPQAYPQFNLFSQQQWFHLLIKQTKIDYSRLTLYRGCPQKATPWHH